MNNQQKRIQQTMDLLGVLLIILAVHSVVGAFNGKWPWSGNAYNSYLLQAESWLQGRLDLGQNYEYLELAESLIKIILRLFQQTMLLKQTIKL